MYDNQIIVLLCGLCGQLIEWSGEKTTIELLDVNILVECSFTVIKKTTVIWKKAHYKKHAAK